MITMTFDEFRLRKLAQGFDQVLEREWASGGGGQGVARSKPPMWFPTLPKVVKNWNTACL